MEALMVFAVSLIITFIAYRYTVAKGMVDIPNSRSSHTRPTPRGGGVSFVLTYSAYLVVSGLRHTVDRNTVIALIGGGLMIAFVGWIDDRNSLSSSSRFMVHIASAVWAIWWINLHQLDLGIIRLTENLLIHSLGTVMIVWFINLFNFMDGIDGIASVEAASCGLAIWVLSRGAAGAAVAGLTLVLAASVMGFLPMNWSPAKIFMGDVGSGYLGFMIGALSIASEGLGGPPFWIWAVLVGVFITDATLTLIRRITGGERWHEPHRSHVYQLAVQAGHSHRKVTALVLAANLCLAAICLFSRGRLNSGLLTVAPFATLTGLHIMLYNRWREGAGSRPIRVRGSMHHSG
jgi:Fuc2NAc and GlcNAc transferase